MIKLTAIGHLGKDCTVNSVNGKNVINFTVAHSEKFKNNEGVQVDKTTWLSVRIFSVQLLGSKDSNSQPAPTESHAAQNSDIPDNGGVVDDLPF
jgi:hypothetical protein